MKKRVGFSPYNLRIPIYSWCRDDSFRVWNDFVETRSLFKTSKGKYRLFIYFSKDLTKVFKTL
jgi:hypothetical protein